jgi:hypothetical protein
MVRAADSATSGGAAGGCRVSDQVCALATSTFQHGFTDATRATLILPVAVLVLGAMACLAMARQQRPTFDLPSTPPVPVPESV